MFKPVDNSTHLLMLKILHARLQHYANQELPDIQGEFRKERGTRDQIANICWIIEIARGFQKKKKKSSISVSSMEIKPLTLDHDKLWKALREMEIPDHLTCLLRNLYVSQEATVRTLYGTRVVQDRKRSVTELSAVALFV